MAIRLAPDGATDDTFGGNGLATIPPADPEGYAIASGAALDGAGRLVVTGSSGARLTPSTFFVARFRADGALDPAFNGDGVVTTAFPGRTSASRDVAVLPDGTIVVAGQADAATGNAAQWDVALARYDDEGGLDPSFGDGGRALVGSPTAEEVLNAISVGADGAVSISARSGAFYDGQLLLARVDPSGRPDPVVDGDGVVVTGAHWSEGRALALGPGGTFVTAGEARRGFADYDFAVRRYSASGAPDAAFGADGRAVTNFAAMSPAEAFAAAVMPDGKVVVVGRGPYDPDAGWAALVTRFTAGGRPDPSFGEAGTVLFRFGGRSTGLAAVAPAADGKFLVAGSTCNATSQRSEWLVARFNADGSLDATFGQAGGATVAMAGWGPAARAIAVQPDGSMVAGTTTRDFTIGVGWTDKDFALVEIPLAGGIGSWPPPTPVVVDFAGGDDTLHDLVLMPDGKIVAVGTAAAGPDDGSPTDFALARLMPDWFDDLVLDPTFGGDGKVTTDVAGFGDRAVAAAVSPFGRLVVAGTAVVPLRATDFAVARYLMTDASPLPAVAGANVFYRGAPADRLLPAGGAADDAAVAADKRPLLPGQTPAFRNVTSYTRGINGVMVDVVNPYGTALTAEDFTFRFADGRTGAWAAGPAPASLTVRHGAGTGGSDRVTLAWNDFVPGQRGDGTAVANGWLEVTLRANDNTRLATPYTFRVGNLVGETGRGLAVDVVSGRWRVDPLDAAATRAAQGRPASRTSAYDFNRDGRVNAVDLAVVRAGQGRRLVPAVPMVTPAAVPVRQLVKRREAYDLLA